MTLFDSFLKNYSTSASNNIREAFYYHYLQTNVNLWTLCTKYPYPLTCSEDWLFTLLLPIKVTHKLRTSCLAFRLAQWFLALPFTYGTNGLIPGHVDWGFSAPSLQWVFPLEVLFIVFFMKSWCVVSITCRMLWRLYNLDSDIWQSFMSQHWMFSCFQFVESGGLKHLFNIFMSGSLEAKSGQHWNLVCHSVKSWERHLIRIASLHRGL